MSAADGQGLMLTVTRIEDERVVVLSWNTYLQGEQRWLIGAGQVGPGSDSVTIPMQMTLGGDWAQLHDETLVEKWDWCNVALSFSSCDQGELMFDSLMPEYGTGTVSLSRITDTEGLICEENTDADTATIDSLKFMREEEKLARDTYLALYALWGNNLFNNIAQSEQSHMDAMLMLLDTYGIEDPAVNEAGVFTNSDLQALYDELVETGAESLESALKVGALIEEVDIRDIEAGKAVITAQDILSVYDNLLCGSRNHLRSFASQWETITGSLYEAQIPEFSDEVEMILSTPQEQCGP